MQNDPLSGNPVAPIPSLQAARVEAERGLLGAALLAPDVLDEFGRRPKSGIGRRTRPCGSTSSSSARSIRR